MKMVGEYDCGAWLNLMLDEIHPVVGREEKEGGEGGGRRRGEKEGGGERE